MAKCTKCGGTFKNLGVHERFCKETTDKDVTDLLATTDTTIELKDMEVIVPGNKEIKSESEKDIPEQGESKLFSAINNLTELMKDFGQRLEKVEKVAELNLPEPEYTANKDETYPNKRKPTQYAKIVEEILTPEFEFDIEDIDALHFQLTVYVPERYSSLAKEDRDNGMKDVRSKVIPTGVGENGVRDWCKLIRGNSAKYFTAKGTESPFKQ